MGTSHVPKLAEWKNKNPTAKIGSEEASKFGEIIVLAVKERQNL